MRASSTCCLVPFVLVGWFHGPGWKGVGWVGCWLGWCACLPQWINAYSCRLVGTTVGTKSRLGLVGQLVGRSVGGWFVCWSVSFVCLIVGLCWLVGQVPTYIACLVGWFMCVLGLFACVKYLFTCSFVLVGWFHRLGWAGVGLLVGWALACLFVCWLVCWFVNG